MEYVLTVLNNFSGTNKTIEGTLGCILSQLGVIFALIKLGMFYYVSVQYGVLWL